MCGENVPYGNGGDDQYCTGCLDEHHRDAECADELRPVRMYELGYVLHRLSFLHQPLHYDKFADREQTVHAADDSPRKAAQRRRTVWLPLMSRRMVTKRENTLSSFSVSSSWITDKIEKWEKDVQMQADDPGKEDTRPPCLRPDLRLHVQHVSGMFRSPVRPSSVRCDIAGSLGLGLRVDVNREVLEVRWKEHHVQHQSVLP
jgi:hypothetical protein